MTGALPPDSSGATKEVRWLSPKPAFLPALRPSYVAALRSSRRHLRRSLITAQLAADDGDNEEADGEEKKKQNDRPLSALR
jgi:hypothetical protein